jgi:hypothetical protein
VAVTREATLFELSYEIANFQGGIGSVIASKAQQTMRHFDRRYICLGPLLTNKKQKDRMDDKQEVRIYFDLMIIFSTTINRRFE